MVIAQMLWWKQRRSFVLRVPEEERTAFVKMTGEKEATTFEK